MLDTSLSLIPSARREHVQSALREVLGLKPLTGLWPLSGGASGASIYRFEAGAHAYVLRLDILPGRHGNPQRGYTCMRIAAEAGIAPKVYFADAATGIAIMDYISPKALEAHPGGWPAVLRELGGLVARLQATSTFPPVPRFDAALAVMLSELRQRGLFRPGVLDAHQEGFERIRASYPWQSAGLVSSHNDPNTTNIVSDGSRLWLIDWETGFCNDPLADIANVSLNFYATPELDAILLTSWLGRTPDAALCAKFIALRQLCRLYCACLAFGGARGPWQNETLSDALTPPQLIAAFRSGSWVPGPIGMLAIGKCYLATFENQLSSPELAWALKTLSECGCELQAPS